MRTLGRPRTVRPHILFIFGSVILDRATFNLWISFGRGLIPTGKMNSTNTVSPCNDFCGEHPIGNREQEFLCYLYVIECSWHKTSIWCNTLEPLIIKEVFVHFLCHIGAGRNSQGCWRQDFGLPPLRWLILSLCSLRTILLKCFLLFSHMGQCSLQTVLWKMMISGFLGFCNSYRTAARFFTFPFQSVTSPNFPLQFPSAVSFAFCRSPRCYIRKCVCCLMQQLLINDAVTRCWNGISNIHNTKN